MNKLLKNWLFNNKNKPLGLFAYSTALTCAGKSCIVLLFTLITKTLVSQNLVPNPSFEINSNCPDTNPYTINYVSFWSGAGTSVDYYNVCSTNPSFTLPSQWWGGFQYPKSGNAYVGFSAYYLSSSPVRREYLQTKLIDSLKSNECYLVKYYVNLSNSSIWGTNNLAANFSSNNFTDSLEQLIPLQPHIFKFRNPIIIDTANWVEILGLYSAQGNESYLTIGNFKDNYNTDTVTTNYSTSMNGGYYFIDDVSVIPIDSIPGGMPAFAGNDTTIIAGDSVFIGQEITNLVCNWYVGSTLIADSTSGIFVSPTSTTTYTVEQFLCGTISYDTVTVYVSGVGVEENSWSQHIHLFPNPSNGNVNLQVEKQNTTALTVQVFNLTGELLYKQELEENKGQANFSLHLANGIYFVHITNTRTNEQIVKKLVIQY